ncbi:IclR family transcriptional regulator [Arthrobacter echini]|uniref:IclR family transcriptional regulator n=1 Tax=Arthrobacter echini TaxID=1529066 RepID=A0A4S5EA91_9MICC|nr:IclR family transcriptional regulator [Arthrobacter echini]THJ68608.1 IclR family transcriptional regulator [Arthrobacter echini]
MNALGVADTAPRTQAGTPPSQTLSRGIRVLEILAEATGAMTIADIAAALGVHRSIAYRIIRTLEDHGLVLKDPDGGFRIGPGMASLARGVARDLQSVALPELTALAARAQMTAFIAVVDRRHCVTLVAVEPPHGEGTIVQRPGSRHRFDAGAPGIAIQAALGKARWEQLAPDEIFRDESHAAAAKGYAVSCDEVIPGVSSVAAPILVPGQLPAALAVVYVSSDHDVADLGQQVARTARAVEALL